MSDFEQRFETFLQGNVHPEEHHAARRLTHPTLGRISMEAYLDVADHLQRSHRAFDHDLDEGQAVVGWTPEGEFVDSHAQIIERTPIAQADFDRRTQ